MSAATWTEIERGARSATVIVFDVLTEPLIFVLLIFAVLGLLIFRSAPTLR